MTDTQNRPLDEARRTDLVIQGNVVHLFTLHCINAMATLDNAHRYMLNVSQKYDLDETKASVNYRISYTYKGKAVNISERLPFYVVRGSNASDVYRESLELVQRLSYEARKRWEIVHG